MTQILIGIIIILFIQIKYTNIMATIQEVIQNGDEATAAVTSAIADLKQQIADLKNQPPSVATQEELDQVDAKFTAIKAAVN